MGWIHPFYFLYQLSLKEFATLFVKFIQNHPIKLSQTNSYYPLFPYRAPRGRDNIALSRHCESSYNCYTQDFMQKVNHMSWRGGVDMCFYISTEHGCS